MADERDLFVVGSGAVGTSLAAALREAGYHLLGAWNRGAERALAAGRELGIDVATGPWPAVLRCCDLVLVCVADNALSSVAEALAGQVRHGAVVAHTSGCLSSRALAAISGAHLGSLHPLVAVPHADPALLLGAAFAVEGDREANAALEAAATALGGRVFRLSAAAKPGYHAAAAMASNLIVALLGDAVTCARAAGVENAQQLMTELAAGAVQQVVERGVERALTGPVVRGDVATVAEHLRVLSPEIRSVYRAISRRALVLARKRGLAEDAERALERLLDAGES